MKTILALETATNACSAALLHRGNIVERFELAPRQHSSLLLPMIDDLLSEQQVLRSDIDAIAFGRGPGSFMGVRLAMGVAQGLGYALNKPLIAVSTLHILAQTAHEAYGVEEVVSAWDARMGEMYWGEYQLQNGVMSIVAPDVLTAPREVMHVSTSAALVGNAWMVYRSELNSVVTGKRTCFTDCYPHAASLLTLADRLASLNQVESAFSIQPVYIRDKIC